jgi:hypothetical protein
MTQLQDLNQSYIDTMDLRVVEVSKDKAKTLLSITYRNGLTYDFLYLSMEKAREDMERICLDERNRR